VTRAVKFAKRYMAGSGGVLPTSAVDIIADAAAFVIANKDALPKNISEMEDTIRRLKAEIAILTVSVHTSVSS
jgi:ATP-dependent Clp protease ATP-binding subunit ClpA